MFKILFKMLLIINIISSKCGPGCLICQPDNKCIFCNFKDNYILNKTKECKKIDIPLNCKIAETSEKCYTCNTGFYLDKGICIKNSDKIENCLLYKDDKICDTCKNNFYISNSKCIEVPNEQIIFNCMYYKNIKECKQCEDNYILNYNNSKCIEINNIDCLANESIICTECVDKFNIFENKYFQRFDINSLIDIYYWKNKTEIINCEENTVDNCKLSVEYNKCTECNKNYHLSINDKCERYPVDSIDNCEEYSDLFNCKKCIISYYLKNNECIKNNLIEGCNLSHPTLVNKCEICISKYYKTNDSICLKRRYFPITDCITYNESNDYCNECIEYKLLSSNKKSCLDIVNIKSCSEYKVNSDNIIFCSKCTNDQHIYSNKLKKCIFNNNIYCESLDKNDNCILCVENYYLDEDNICVYNSHIIDSCVSYNKDKNNECNRCDYGYFLADIYNCVANPFKGCLEVEKYIPGEYFKCSRCQKGYYLDTSNSINIECKEILIKNNNNCLSSNSAFSCLECEDGYYFENPTDKLVGCYFQNSKCKKFINKRECRECLKGYFLDASIKQCILPPNEIKLNCNSYKSHKECESCKHLYIPESLDSLFYCLKYDNFINSCIRFSKVNNNCEICYGVNNNGICSDVANCKIPGINSCNLCLDGYILSSDKKICFSKGSSFPTDCHQAIGDINNILNPNPSSVSCFKCKDKFVPIYTTVDLSNQLNLTTNSNKFIKEYSIENNNPIYYDEKIFKISSCIFEDDFNYKYNSCSNILLTSGAATTPVPDPTLTIKECKEVEIHDGYRCCLKCNKSKVGIKNTAHNFLIDCSTDITCSTEKYTLDPDVINNNTNIDFLKDCLVCQSALDVVVYDNNVIYPTCVTHTTITGSVNNCQIYLRNTPNISCIACKPTFNLTSGNICQLISSCASSKMLNKCEVCSTGSILNQNNICITKTTVIDNFQHCTKVDDSSNPPVCIDCEDNYKIDNNICKSIKNILNCDSNGVNGCLRCNYGYFSLFLDQPKNCKLKNLIDFKISNCKSNLSFDNCKECNEGNLPIYDGINIIFCLNRTDKYENCIEASAEGNCRKCNDEFYIENGECKLGDISNCKLYEGNNKCLECKSEFHLKIIVKKDGNKEYYCLKNFDILGCEIFDKTNGSCTKCYQNDIVNYFLDKSKLVKSCKQMIFDENCLIYDVDTSLCTNCLEEYYVFNGKCRQRDNGFIDNCLEYTPNKDTCQECFEDYALNEFNLKCENKPNGIKNCIEYRDLDNCDKCKTGYYLHNNKCIFVYHKVINYCEIYLHDGICTQCMNNYTLKDGLCIIGTITNCKSYGKNNFCKICEDNYFYDKKTNYCVKYIENCKVMSEDLSCKICNKNYYFTNKCTLVEPKIENCIEYSNNKNCLKCNEGYFLTIEKTKCIQVSINYKNCTNTIESLKCSICKGGKYLKNGKCNNCPSEGCEICDPYSVNQCYMCSTDYYQNKFGKCIKLNSTSSSSKSFLSSIFFLIVILYYN